MRDLDCLLLLEVGSAVDREDGPVGEAGETEQLAPDQTAPRAERLRTAVLHHQVRVCGKPLHGDVANDVARCGARRTKR